MVSNRAFSTTFFTLTVGTLACVSVADAAEEQDLGEVLVTAESVQTPAIPQTTTYGTQHNVVDRQQIENQSAMDVNHALSMVPGVLTRSETMIGGQTGHGIYVRGRGASHPSSEVSITFDGVPRMGSLYGQTLFDGVSLGSVESVEVFKSPQPSQFGSGYAAVNLQPRKMTQEGFAGDIALVGGSHQTFNEGLSTGYKKDSFDIYAAQDWTSTAGHVAHSRAQQQNYYLNTGWQVSPNHEIRFLANQTKSQTLQPSNAAGQRSADRYDTDTTFFTVTLNNTYENSDGFIKAYYNDTDYDIRNERSSSGALSSSVQTMKLYGVRAKQNWRIGDPIELSVGFDLDRSEMSNRNLVHATQTTRYWDFPKTTLFSPYVGASYAFSLDDVRITPSAGFRFYKHSEFKDAVSPQVGVVVNSGIVRWNANYARAVNYPSPVVLQGYVRRGATGGDWTGLKPEVADHYETGIGFSFNETDSVNVTVFHDRGKDRFRVYMSPAALPVWNDPIGRYKVTGAELSAQGKLMEALDAFAAVTYMDVRAMNQAGRTEKHMPYSPKWMVQAGASWQMNPVWKLYADALYVSDLWGGTNARPQGFGYRSGSTKLKDFLLVNLKLSRKIQCPQGFSKNGEIYLTINNLLNRDYSWESGYPMPGTTAFVGVKFGF